MLQPFYIHSKTPFNINDVDNHIGQILNDIFTTNGFTDIIVDKTLVNNIDKTDGKYIVNFYFDELSGLNKTNGEINEGFGFFHYRIYIYALSPDIVARERVRDIIHLLESYTKHYNNYSVHETTQIDKNNNQIKLGTVPHLSRVINTFLPDRIQDGENTNKITGFVEILFPINYI